MKLLMGSIGGVIIFCCAALFYFTTDYFSSPPSLVSPLPLEISEEITLPLTTFSNILPKNTSHDIVNILVLGLDARKQDTHPRCDAIHLISIDFHDQDITIVSIPRGTPITVAENGTSSIISNVCHSMGIDYAVRTIEKLTNVHIDHTVKVGFSQTLGILRTVGLPTTSTLQFLRNRQYGIGDHQRTHNQANFMKDMFIHHFRQVATLPSPVKYLLYTYVDTSMEYDTALQLVNKLLQSNIDTNPSHIKLISLSPNLYSLKELHVSTLSGNQKNAPDTEYHAYQQDLDSYLTNLTQKVSVLEKQGKTAAIVSALTTPISKKIWLQIEDPKKRHAHELNLLTAFVQSSPADTNIEAYVENFITEMTMEQDYENLEKGKALLSSLSSR